MEALLQELSFERAKTLALQKLFEDENLLRLKAEGSLQELRRIHQTLACTCEMSEEFIVNKVTKRLNLLDTKMNINMNMLLEALTHIVRSTKSAYLQDRKG
jgi:hypothetical protein